METVITERRSGTEIVLPKLKNDVRKQSLIVDVCESHKSCFIRPLHNSRKFEKFAGHKMILVGTLYRKSLKQRGSGHNRSNF